ncbi:MAG: diguanylate cyclase domain-containing protein [Rhodoferax sp.]
MAREEIIDHPAEPPARADHHGTPLIAGAPSLTLAKFGVAAVLAGALITVVGLGFVAPETSVRTTGPALLFLIAALAWYLMVRGKIAAAIYVLAFGVWSVMTLIAVFTGGVRAPVVIAYPVLILMSGWLIHARAALVLASITVLATLAFFLAQHEGFLPPPLATPVSIYVGDQILVYLVSAALVVFVLRAYQRRLQELGDTSRDLAQRTLALEESKAELHRAQAVARVGSWVYDIPADRLRLSAETCRIFGLPEGTGASHADYLLRVHPADRNDVEQAWQRALQGEDFDHTHRILVGKTVRWVRQKAESRFGPDGLRHSAVGVTQDVTELKQAQAAMQESEQRYRTMIEWTPESILVHRHGQIVYANPAAIKLFGAADAATLMRKQTAELVHPDDLQVQTERMNNIYARAPITPMVAARFLRLDGRVIDVEVQGTAIIYDGAPAIHVCIRDISARKQLEDQIRQLAFYDHLTGLPNRRLLTDRLSQAMTVSKRSSCYAALLFLDLDNFKPLNDEHGHAAGDLLLAEAATRLLHCVRQADTVARFGGDEFVVLLTELDQGEAPSRAQAAVVAEKIRASLSDPYRLAVKTDEQSIQHIEHHCTVSIGVVLFSGHESPPDDVIKGADSAMYQAKQSGRNSVRFYARDQAAG